ncbi:MAG: DEAD/DEAH box helicase [Desulfosarcina sp.]|nr:DEAD/DEAH box helicase [Desulfobacterales bacterium]
MKQFKLRDYQIKALNKIDADLQKQKTVLLVAIMGAGKTVLTARLINKYYKTSGKRFLILAHKQELVEQFHKTFLDKSDVLISDIGICCTGLSQKKQLNRRVTIGTIQTFVNQMDNYLSCDLLVIDEAHKIQIGTGSQYDQVIDGLQAKNPNMRILGLTATPFRLGSGYIYGNRCSPGTINLFSEISHKITYAELVEQGYLMPLSADICTNDQLSGDLQQVDKNGDYVLDQLGAVMAQPIHIKTAVQAINEKAQDYKTICVFACTIDHAEKLKDAIDDKFPGHVTIVHSKLTSLERASNMLAWKKGRKRIMVSINILIEGFDFPQLDCLVMCRPTESTGLFLQSIGRLLRIHPDKEKILLIDLTTNTDKFGTDLDNMKVTIPKNAINTDKKKNEKYCPECDEKVHIAIRICPGCGFEWTTEANEKIIAEQMPELKRVMFQPKKEEKLFPDIPDTWHDVYNIDASLHTSKQNGNKLGRIDCYYDNPDDSSSLYRDVYISVYFCFSDYYEGYAVEMAKTKWIEFSSAPFPKTVEDFKTASDCFEIKQPNRVLLDHNGKYPQLKELDFSEKKDDLPF